MNNIKTPNQYTCAKPWLYKLSAILLGLFALALLTTTAQAQICTNSVVLKIYNNNASASETPVLDSDGSNWTQVYVEIPAKLYIEQGWLQQDLSNLTFYHTGTQLTHWVPTKKDNNFKVDRMGVWLLVNGLNFGENTIKVCMDSASEANPRATGGDRTQVRDAYAAASSVFPFYAFELNDGKFSDNRPNPFDLNGWYTNPNVEFAVNTLNSEDDYRLGGADVKTGADAITGNEFTISILNMKFYDAANSEAVIYFLSAASDTTPDNLDIATGYRLWIRQAADFGTVDDDFHFDRQHFEIELQRNEGSGWVAVARLADRPNDAADELAGWYPYNNTRHVFDLKVGSHGGFDTIGLRINGMDVPFGPYGVSGGGDFIDGRYKRPLSEPEPLKKGRFGYDRRGWIRSSNQDIQYTLLRRYQDLEPGFEVYGNVDAVIGDGTPDLGENIIELFPSFQQITKNIGGNTLDDYVFSTFNIAHEDQIIDTFKLRLRNRGSSSDTYDLTFTNSDPNGWLLYYCDQDGANCTRTIPATETVPGGGEIVRTLQLIPTPAALFEGAMASIDINVQSQGDLSIDNVRFNASALTQLGCFWEYKARQTISWPGGHGFEELNDHQVLVKIDGEPTLSAARPDGEDIVFTDAVGNQLNFWLKSIDTGAGDLEAWVDVNEIAVGNTTIYVWWGNPAVATSRSSKSRTFDLWEDWTEDYALNDVIGCDDTTAECSGYPADPHGWANVPTPDDFYNWWERDVVGGLNVLQSDRSAVLHSSDTGPYIHKGLLGWDHYEISYRLHSGTYTQYSGGGTWGNPQFNPVFYNDSGNMWGQEYFADKYIFRPYASGIDYVWQYQTNANNILSERFPGTNQWYWAKVRVFKDKDTGQAQLRVRMATDEPADIDTDVDYEQLADFNAPPIFSLDYGEIGFGGWDSGFSFTDIRVRKYIEDSSGDEPSVTPGPVEQQSPRDQLALNTPQVTPPIFGGRPAYLESQAVPFAWLGDIQAFYADCLVNEECRTGEVFTDIGTYSIFGSIDADTPKGAGFHLMKRDPEDNNGSMTSGDARVIYTTDGVDTDFVDFELDNCGALQASLGAIGACDDLDGFDDATEKLIKYVRGQYIAPEGSGMFSRSVSCNFDGIPGYDNGTNNDNGPDEQWKLGDLLHSNPIQIGIPNMGFAVDDYYDFVTEHSDRDLVAYFMTNEGMLHAVRLAHYDDLDLTYQPDTEARELWSFIPNAILPLLGESTDARHEYLTDGLLRAIDIQIGGNWRTVLFGLLGRGGQSFFAMDVTDPYNPELLWERAGDNTTIGTTISAPALGQVNGDWVAILGSGWDIDYANNYEGKRAWLTMYNLETGALMRQIKVSEKPGNVLTEISTLRDPASGIIQEIFFGDYYGVLWAVDKERLENPATPTDLEDSYRLFVPDDYAAIALPSDSPRPITVRPRIAKGPENTEFWVYFGTGDYDENVGSYDNQAFYGLRVDAGPFTEAGLFNMTASGGINGLNQSWFIELGNADSRDVVLDDGSQSSKTVYERVIRPAEVFGGFVFFTTFEPNNALCGGGISRFYALDYRSGGFEPQLFIDVGGTPGPADDVRSVELQSSGIPSQPIILEGQDGDGSAIATGVVSNTEGGIEKVKLNPNKFSTALDILLWREKQ